VQSVGTLDGLSAAPVFEAAPSRCGEAPSTGETIIVSK